MVPSTSKPGRLGDYPFAGLRILDLGIIVAGGELSRLFGDLGAEVIKIESADYPDGLRQARVGDAMSESFAWTHRNHLAIGPATCAAQRARRSSAAWSPRPTRCSPTSSPEPLPRLGFPTTRCMPSIPRIVLAGSSAFGNRGPWSSRMGYGPLVRAAAGVTRLWTSEATSEETQADGARHAFYDATTIFPDHVVGRVTAIVALAALIRRDRTGDAAHVHISQAEVVVNQLDTLYVTRPRVRRRAARHPRRHQRARGLPVRGRRRVVRHLDPLGRATGDALQRFSDHPEWAEDPRFATGEARVAHRRELVALVSDWTRCRTPTRAAEALQSAGFPAGPMNRRADILEDPQLIERKLFSDMAHPLIDHPLPAETGPAPFRHIPPAPQRPAPLPGQDTREICRDVLGMSAEADRAADRTIACCSTGRQRRPRRSPKRGRCTLAPECAAGALVR